MSVASHLGELAAALVDGELDHDARDRTLVHLARCASCRADVDAMRQLKARLAAMSDPGPSAALMGRLLAVGAPPQSDSFGPGDLGGPSGRSRSPVAPRPSERGAPLGPPASRANAVPLRRRPAVRRARAAVRAGVRLAAGRSGGSLAAGRGQGTARPRQRARLAAVGCFSIMIVAMGTAFTMEGQVSSRPSSRPMADGPGAGDGPSTAWAATIAGRSLRNSQPAAAARARFGASADSTPGRALAEAANSALMISAVADLAEVGPDARASTFAGTEYLTDCREIHRDIHSRPGSGPAAELQTPSDAPGWQRGPRVAAHCGGTLHTPHGSAPPAAGSAWRP
jgi:hypothetical protein